MNPQHRHHRYVSLEEGCQALHHDLASGQETAHISRLPWERIREVLAIPADARG